MSKVTEGFCPICSNDRPLYKVRLGKISSGEVGTTKDEAICRKCAYKIARRKVGTLVLLDHYGNFPRISCYDPHEDSEGNYTVKNRVTITRDNITGANVELGSPHQLAEIRIEAHITAEQYLRLFPEHEETLRNEHCSGIAYNRVSCYDPEAQNIKREDIHMFDNDNDSVIKGMFNKSKDAAKMAARMKVGSDANKLIVAAIRKNTPVLMRPYLDNKIIAIFLPVVGAGVMKAVQHFVMDENKKAEYVCDAALENAVFQLVDKVNVIGIIKNIVGSVTVDALDKQFGDAAIAGLHDAAAEAMEDEVNGQGPKDPKA